MSDHMADNAAPSAAEIAAIRLFHERRKHNQPLTYNEKDKYVRLEDGSIIAYVYAAHSFGYRFASNENDIDRLLAAVEAQAARIGALEAENVRMRAALEADDRSVEASIAYLNSTSGGTKNDVPDDRSEGE